MVGKGLDLELASAVSIEAAEAAGALLREQALGAFEVRSKGSGDDLVTELDLASEALIVSRLRRAFPAHRIVTEEAGELPGSGHWTWLVDPLDGTNNLAIGLAVFAVGIALCELGLPMVSVVHDVPASTTWAARRGGGAHGPRGPLRICRPVRDRPLTLAWIQGHEVARNDALAVALKARLERESKRVLGLWAPLLSWVMVARGDIDGIVAYQAGGMDLHAGLLIAREAGIETRCLDGGAFDERFASADDRYSLVAGSPAIVDRLLDLAADERTVSAK
ncbi:MAG TPA: inositol monophosphatase [Actinomycetes bacterium]|jgi:myo-inositol-1(or 4)-monophosphatase|nr:inositol monophosphatase [Actinomycetes bacterium]